jgi:hypothetical protein
MSDSGVVRTTDVRRRFWGVRASRDNGVPPVKWYRLQFHPPFFVLIAAVSALFLLLVPLIASRDADYPSYVGAYLSLLSLAVLLPLAFKANTASGLFPAPAAPFVALNFLYFVVGTLALLADPSSVVGNVSLPTVPMAILLLAACFALYAAGNAFSGGGIRTWLPKSVGVVTVRGMGILVAVVAGVVWTLRLHFATLGLGITHAAGFGLLGRDAQAVVTAMGEIQYVPICLCLTRLCSSSLPRSKVRAWQIGLAIVLTSDAVYFMWAGARLQLLLEFTLLLWFMWLRLIPRFSRRWYLYTGLVLAVSVPVVYAQRAALRIVSPRAGENQLVFTRDVLLGEQARLLEGSAGGTVKQGFFGGDVGRLTAVGPVSDVADKIYNDDYPLMWGETLIYGLPMVVPQALWPSKPVVLPGKNLIQRHFGLRFGDETGTIEEETLANFGIVGLCVWMFLFGVLTNIFFRYLIKMAPAHEPVALCLFYVLPRVCMVETDISGVAAGLRLVPVLFVLLMLFSTRHKPPA